MPKLSSPPSKFQISLASKMIPSPDWIVGVSKETLCEENWQDHFFEKKLGRGKLLNNIFFSAAPGSTTRLSTWFPLTSAPSRVCVNECKQRTVAFPQILLRKKT